MNKIKIFIFGLLIFSFSIVAYSQTTSVSATIEDSDSIYWANCTWTVRFFPNPNYPNPNMYYINGVNITSPTYSQYLNQTGTCNGSGALSFTALDNSQISPSGSQWQITVQSNTSAPATQYKPITITGATDNLSTYLSSNSIAPRFPALNTQYYGYSDVEIFPEPNPGGQYFNVSTLNIRYWNGIEFTNMTFNGGTLTGITDISLFNPVRSNAFSSNLIIGGINSYNLNGTIPGTSEYNYGQLNHYFMVYNYLDSIPGCWGFVGTCYNTEHSVNATTANVLGGGGTNISTITGNFFSVGDHVGSENYISSFGGSIDSGGPEGTKGQSWFVGESTNTWTGTVQASHGGAGQTTIYSNCTADCGASPYGIVSPYPASNSGSPASLGQGLWITDEQSTTASGQIESYTSASGEIPGTVTVNITGGLSNLAVSTCEATLVANVEPTVNPSGSGSIATTFTVNIVNGTCTSGGLISFAGTNHEQAIITTVTAPSGGQQTITANLRLYHESGSYVFENSSSDAGLFGEITVSNTSGLSFPFEVLGIESINSNTVIMWWRYWYTGSEPSYTGFPIGRMSLVSQTNASLSNTGGTVTTSIGLSQAEVFNNNASALYISNASNSAFDGACTSPTAVVTSNPNVWTLTCTQSASSGDTATGATITLTDSTNDNPYGNSRVNFYQGAAIIDSQDYTNPIIVNGVTNYPVDGLYFQVESNDMPLTAGDSLVEHHSSGQFHNQVDTVGVEDTNQYNSEGIELELNNIFANFEGSVENNNGIYLDNITANSQYQYFGGQMTPVDAFTFAGLWENDLDTNYPPAFGGNVINVRNCPPSPSSCSDVSYYYNLFTFVGSGGDNYARYYPSANRMVWNGTQSFDSGLSNNYAFEITNGSFINYEIGFAGMTGSGAYVPLIQTSTTPTVGDLVEFSNATYECCGLVDTGVAATSVIPLTGTSSSLGGSALALNSCASTTVTVTGATSSMGVIVTPASDPNSTSQSYDWYGTVTSTNTVTVKLCAIVAGTPSATTYNVRVIP